MMGRLDIADCINDVCPVSGRPVSADALALYRGAVVGFSSRASRDEFLAAILMFESARIVPAHPIRRRPERPAERAFAGTDCRPMGW